MNDSGELEREDFSAEAESPSRRSTPLIQMPVVLALVGKVLAGSLAALAIVTAWGVWAPTSEFVKNMAKNNMVMTPSGARPATETQVAGWEDTRDYGVLYPLNGGDDTKDFMSFPPSTPNNTMWPALTADLYPLLDAAGAIFIDAGAYMGPAYPHAVLPRLPIRVNLNYLAKYPILGEDHQPVVVDPAETAWVVAIPATYKEQEAKLAAYMLQMRRGGPDVEGAFQFQERMPGPPPPESLRNQEVRIIWTEPGQDVFTFDSTINSSGGNMIVDPIVEIMTPANGLPGDRLNMVSGPNGTLKVFTGGDPAGTYADLLPTLRRLQLDDNLPHLVFANEAPLTRFAIAEAETRISRATAASVALVMLALGAASAVMIVARLRRVLIVRRLHGFSMVRRNRELVIAGGISTLGMLVFGGLALLGDKAGGYAPASYRGIASGGLVDISIRLGAVILVLSAVELILALLIAAIIQRRTGALLVKQL